MRAMIFAAGLGTRLRPLTDNLPKALVKINEDQTLLDTVVERLKSFKINEIIINVHHHADKIIEHLKNKNNYGIKIEISDERDELLDTGGGLLKARWFFNDDQPFLVHNVDILSDIDLDEMLAFHFEYKSLATLAVRKRETSRYLLFNEKQELCGWQNIKTQEKIIARQDYEKLSQRAFSGIQILNPEIFKHIKHTGSFSIIDAYLDLAEKHKIIAFDHTESKWLDVGKKESLQLAQEISLQI